MENIEKTAITFPLRRLGHVGELLDMIAIIVLFDEVVDLVEQVRQRLIEVRARHTDDKQLEYLDLKHGSSK